MLDYHRQRWLIVGIIQWQVLDMSMTLFVSDIICVAVFLYSMSQMKKSKCLTKN